jgi:hypothetical protein
MESLFRNKRAMLLALLILVTYTITISAQNPERQSVSIERFIGSKWAGSNLAEILDANTIQITKGKLNVFFNTSVYTFTWDPEMGEGKITAHQRGIPKDHINYWFRFSSDEITLGVKTENEVGGRTRTLFMARESLKRAN